MVPSLNRTFPGKVARFSVDVREDTRTMHTEVDVPNPSRVLLPGLYAEATITLEKKDDAVAVPLQAVDQENGQATVDVVDPSNKIEAPANRARHPDRDRCRSPFRLKGRRAGGGQRSQRPESRAKQSSPRSSS